MRRSCHPPWRPSPPAEPTPHTAKPEGRPAMADAATPDTRFNLSRWAIEHRSVTRFLLAIVVIAGVLGVMSIGQKEDPDFTFRDMIVQVMWPGASLTDMQDQVVNK